MRLPDRHMSTKSEKMYLLPKSIREQIAAFLIALNLFLLVFRPFSSSPSTIPHESTIVRTAAGDEIEFHNGGFSSDGSCWCGADSYCMCTPSLAIDLVIVDEDNDDSVWLVRRRDTNQLAVMGGFVQVGETTDQAVTRELIEETGVHVQSSSLSLIGMYDDPTRDKRRHTVSAVYLARFPKGAAPKAGDDVKDVVKMQLTEVEELGPSSFFADHYTILMDYKYRDINTTPDKGSVRGGFHDEKSYRRSICTSSYFVAE